MRRPPAGMGGMLRAFGRDLARIRRARGLSQADLAEATGLSVNSIGNLERGALDPSAVVVALVTVRLGTVGMEISARRFTPIPGPPPEAPFPFPDLPTRSPAIVGEIARVVRARRRRLGLTLEEAARAAGLHPNTLWNLERGLVTPSTSTLFRIYRGLGVRRAVGTRRGIALE